MSSTNALRSHLEVRKLQKEDLVTVSGKKIIAVDL